MQKSILAIAGGQPAKLNPLPPMFPGGMAMDKNEERAVVEVVRNKRLFRYYGPNPGESMVEIFEKKFAEKIGTKYARAVSSGTAALICAYVGAGIGPGDEVIVPAFTWISTASAAIMLGAIPVIAEIDESLTLDPEDVVKKITSRTKAIIPVHMCGAATNMKEIMRISRKYKLKVIEDTAQANGGTYSGKRLGSIGDLGIFSLQFNKIITTGEGGVVVTDNRDQWLRVSAYHDPVSISMGRNISADEAPLFPGQNYRANEFIGALGSVQLKRLDSLVEKMRKNKEYILKGIGKSESLKLRKINSQESDTATNITFTLPTVEQATWFSQTLTAENVKARVLFSREKLDYHIYYHWNQILGKHSMTDKKYPWAKQFNSGRVKYNQNMCPKSLDLLSRSVLIDISPQLTTKELREIVQAILKVKNHLK